MNKNKRNGGGNGTIGQQGARKEAKSKKQENKKIKKQKFSEEKSNIDQVFTKKSFTLSVSSYVISLPHFVHEDDEGTTQ